MFTCFKTSLLVIQRWHKTNYCKIDKQKGKFDDKSLTDKFRVKIVIGVEKLKNFLLHWKPRVGTVKCFWQISKFYRISFMLDMCFWMINSLSNKIFFSNKKTAFQIQMAANMATVFSFYCLVQIVCAKYLLVKLTSSESIGK